MTTPSKLIAVLENNPGCALLLASNGSLLSLNAAARQSLRMDAARQSQDRNFRARVAENSGAAFEKLLVDVFGGQSRTLEFSTLEPGGNRQWKMNASPFCGADGTVTALLGFFHELAQPAISPGERTSALAGSQNLTERKRTDWEFVILGHALNQAAEAVYLINENLRFVYVNEAACRSLGYTREVLLGKGPTDIDPDLTTKQARAMIKKLFAGQYRGNLKSRHRTRDGKVFPVELTASVFEHDGKKFSLAIATDITERQRMEESLAAREREFRTLLENTPDAIVRYDLQGQRIYFNSAFARAVKLAGRQIQEVLGKTALEAPVSSPDVGIRVTETIQRVIRESAPVEYELAELDATGKRYQIHCRFLPEFGPDGKVVSVLNIARDITQQKRAEEQQLAHLHFLECMDRINLVLQGATDSQQMMSDALAVVLSIFNCDRAYLMYPCDPSAPRWTIPVECTKPEYPGVLAQGLFLPMEPEFGKTLRCILDAHGPVKFGPGEHPMVPGLSEQFSIKCFMALAVHPKVGNAWQFGIHQCSYERKWSPEEERLFQEIGRRIGDVLSNQVTLRNLRENESRLAEAERIAQVGYWEHDFESDRVTISDEARGILGLAPAEKITSVLAWQERWLQLLHPEDRDRANEALRAVLRGEESYDVEYRVVGPDRSVRIVRSHAETTRDGSGRTRRIFGILQDVTERRQLEEQLRQSQKMEAIGQLAGGVAHDFNNILTSVLLQVSLGSEEPDLPPEVLESLKQIRSDAQRAANLTRQLLLFSRRQAMQLRDLNLNEVVTNLAKMLQRIIGEDVHLQLHPHPAPLITHADASMLEQLLMNLAVNARDAMPEGGNLVIKTLVRIVDETLARLNPDAQPGRYACLEVSDTGSGIRPEILPHIFEPFFTTKEPGKGTGLGLATVFGIVKQHHGWLTVYSEAGQGTTFRIYLPAMEAADMETVAAAPKPRGGTETILLAEDETSVRNTTRTILARNGYQVLTAANGVEALALWQAHRDSIALLLTDLVMPSQISGLQLARQLQSEKPGLKVVFTSGYSAEIAGRQTTLHPGEDFLQKPFSPPDLLNILRRCLDQP